MPNQTPRPRPAHAGRSRRTLSGAAALALVGVLLAVPVKGDFVASGSILGGQVAFAGWGQPGSYVIVDQTDLGPQPRWHIARVWFALGTTNGGAEHASAANPIEYFYLRLDHKKSSGVDSDANWNIQLNLGQASVREVDHVLRMAASGPDEVSVALLEYPQAEPIVAFTQSGLIERFSNTPGEATFKEGVLVRTGFDGTYHGMEIAVPAAWFTDAPKSLVKADGSGAPYITGAVFSSTGEFSSAVGSVKDILQAGNGETVVVVTNTATGTTTFEGLVATHVAFAAQPEDAEVDQALAPFQVAVLDSQGNLVTDATHDVTLQIQHDPTGGSATLSGTTTKAAVDGIATFTDVSVDTAGQGFTLVAAAPSLDSAVSAPFNITVPPVQAIEVGTWPVALDGSEDTGANWGGWVADPGTGPLTSVNFLKVTNVGDVDTVDFTVDFTDTVFSGSDDPSWSIPLDSNIDFACAETHTGAPPSALTFVPGSVSPTASVTCSFSAGSAGGVGVIYVQYRVSMVPEVMAAQAYVASFTVSGEE